ncbi:CHC2 zinc finger domain-containing protein [Nocardia abscessus]|uniref:CHC2 zinc finger domain-containing protein n=1 Tax=Nocardia abscessus TaxID=120957 RepID=UPI003CC7F0C1
MPDDSLITSVIRRYHPDWEPPSDTGRDWIACLCPFHGETNKSASVSFEHNAFRCHGCGMKGDAISIIRQQEEVNYSEAVRITKEISPGSDEPVPSKLPRKSGRRVFGQAGASDDPQGSARRDRPVQARVRGRPTPWS